MPPACWLPLAALAVLVIATAFAPLLSAQLSEFERQRGETDE